MQRTHHQFAHLSGQRLPVPQPPVCGSGSSAGFTFPKDVLFDGHVDVIYFLNPVRLSYSGSESKDVHSVHVRSIFIRRDQGTEVGLS